jgi:hypothetical protein
VRLRPVPQTAAQWIDEINAAYEDAREALPFAPLVGVAARARDLFHLAPHVAIKFRGLPESKHPIAVEAALSSYVASEGKASVQDPLLAFAFCYLASHFGLDLVSQGAVEEVMDSMEKAAKCSGSRERVPGEIHLPRSAIARRRGPRR